jgi:hypothetical protein
MSGAMAIITNSGIRGWLPRSVCLICLALMWLESVLGLCLGCEIHRLAVRRGWARSDPAVTCAYGACEAAVPHIHEAGPTARDERPREATL